MNIRQAVITKFWLLLVSFIVVCYLHGEDQKTEETMEETKAKIANLKKQLLSYGTEEQETMANAIKKAEEIDANIIKLKNAKRSMGGLSSLGKVEQMKIKAERYELERTNRTELQTMFYELYGCLKKWKEIKKNADDTRTILALQERIVRLQEQKAESKTEKKLDISQYFEHTVKKAATLQEISALPDVYGDEDNADKIYYANRDILKSRTAIVRKGTTLKIPYVEGLEGYVSGGNEEELPSSRKPGDTERNKPNREEQKRTAPAPSAGNNPKASALPALLGAKGQTTRPAAQTGKEQ